MSLAWGSKFLEYSATAVTVDTSPAVFRCPKGAAKLAECNTLHTPRRVSDFQETRKDCKLNSKPSAKHQSDLLALPGGFYELCSAQ
jgi:hypothetical protein